MLQQIIALFVIAAFLARLWRQKQRKEIAGNEFLFWLLFWIVAALAIIFIKYLDRLAGNLGFSASGIDILIYLAVAALFYFVFRLRLKMEKMDKKLTDIIRADAIKNKEKK